jgi:ribosome maturation factor RimP
VDVEFVVHGGHKLVRVLLDKPGGITVGDCARFSRRLADGLDMNQTIPGSYRLEVSSPGIERPLRTLESIARFAGHPASVSLHEPRDGRRNWEGILLGPDGERVGLRSEDGHEDWFEWNEVRSARLMVMDPWRRGGNPKAPKKGAR